MRNGIDRSVAFAYDSDKQSNQFDYRKNCLNTIRLIAAISVLYIHAKTHLGADMPAILTRIIAFFQGVPIFFAMSGFLIWDSAGRSDGFFSYAKKRFLRIYPELWCAVLLGLVVILALYEAPISWGSLGLFTVTQGTILQFWTPNFLRGYGCGTPNGALWTIGVMVQFYVAVYFLHKLLRNKGLRTWLVVLAGAVFVDLLSPLLKSFLPEFIYKLYRQTVIPYAWMFLAGVLLAAKRDVLMPLVRKYWVLLWAASAVLGWTKFDFSMGDYRLFSCLTLVAGMVGFSYQFPKLNIKIDISYGIYVYHMIVVNAMMALGFTGRPEYVWVVLLITCLIAFVSERTVGRWSIQLKKKQ